MAFKLVTILALAYCTSAAVIMPGQNMIARQRQNDVRIDNQSQSAEQLQRQDEYLRNIDQQSNSFQNDYYRQQSNRLRDNEYRRVNYFWNAAQQDRNQYQNREIDQYTQQQDASNAIRQYERQLYEPLLIASATNTYPLYRNYQQRFSPYNSRVTFNSPLVSYRY